MTAIETIQKIEQHQFDDAFIHDFTPRFTRFAQSPGLIDTPYLTATLDWRPDGTRPAMRTGRLVFDQQIDEFLASTRFHSHTPSYESLAADIAAIRAFLDGDVDPSVQGLAFVACSAQHVFEALPLGFPMENRIALGPLPVIRPIVQLVDDEPRYAVLRSSQKDATLTLMDQASARRDVEVHATGFPRKQMQGRWSQRRYQMRADERVEAFIRFVEDETRQMMQDSGVRWLVPAGNDQITTSYRDAAHQTIRERIVGTVRLDSHADENEVIAAGLPVVEEVEQQQEAAVVQRITNGAGPGGGAVVGPIETLAALQTGQVMTLAMNDDFAGEGWPDFELPLYGIRPLPEEDPVGGDASQLFPIRLDEAFIRQALQLGAELEIVRTQPPVTPDETVQSVEGAWHRNDAARRIDEFGGVGAIVRFALADDQSTADLQVS
jgi:hypothetical protein